ncbi:helix-turn-helix transcriptional regulator [Oscillospiraceae bacterium DSM 107454]|uniref:Helix-turn-helix transcriptional regulator n=2 Tax=Ructibacterium gallinarum TaxID=2779355 RepID=A0A9D5M6S4_9FIRM|nr:helix-turn-helix transcriptional regulator [Ructibacterium gallinarum]
MRARNNDGVIRIAKVYTVFETHYTASFYFDGEMHHFWEMVYVIDGMIGVSGDGSVFTLQPGEIIFHKPMEFHKLWAVSHTEPRLFIMSFEAKGEAMELLEHGVFRLDDFQKQQMQSLLDMFRTWSPEALKREKQGSVTQPWLGEPAKLQMFCNMAENVLLSFYADREKALVTQTSENAELYGTLVREMERHKGEKLTVSELAEKCCVSEANVKKLFMKYAGCGPHTYFLNMKVSQAVQLLAKGHRVGEISQMLGFDNPNYFGVVFKRITGYSPIHYKRLYLNR